MSGSDDAGPPVLIIGVGNSLRRDDGAGPAVVRRLARHPLDAIAVLEHNGEGASLMEAWQGFARVVIVDAASSGMQPGTIQRFEAHRKALPGDLLHHSSHLFGVAEAVEMARALGRLPAVLIVYAIEGARFDYGEGLSDEVNCAVVQVSNRVLGELESIAGTEGTVVV